MRRRLRDIPSVHVLAVHRGLITGLLQVVLEGRLLDQVPSLTVVAQHTVVVGIALGKYGGPGGAA